MEHKSIVKKFRYKGINLNPINKLCVLDCITLCKD